LSKPKSDNIEWFSEGSKIKWLLFGLPSGIKLVNITGVKVSGSTSKMYSASSGEYYKVLLCYYFEAKSQHSFQGLISDKWIFCY